MVKTKSDKKNLVKGGGGGRQPYNSNCELSSKCILTKIGEWGGGGGGGGRPGTETKTVCQTVSNEVKTKMQLSTQCRACGTINILKYVNIFLSTNPITFILSSLVSKFCQRI